MHRIRITIIFLLILIIFPTSAISQKEVKTIIVFGAFNANNPAIRIMIEGIQTVLPPEDYNLVVEHLDFTRFPDKDHVKDIVNLYNDKQKLMHVDLLILIGPSVYKELKKIGLNLLDTVPTILVDNKGMSSDPDNVQLPENVVRVNLEYDCHKTLKTIFELFPDNKDVYVISGVSAIDIYFAELIRSNTKDFIETHNFIYVSGISMDSTIRIVERIPVTNIVLIANYQLDINRVSFSSPEALNIISDHSKAPVFALFDGFKVNKGGIGGYVFSYSQVGNETGRVARQILNGTSVKDVAVSVKGFYHYAFDWDELKRWGLLNSRFIPGNSIVYYQPFLIKHLRYVLGAVLFMVALIILILNLIRRNKKQEKLTERMLETEIMHRELIREDRMAKMTELTASLSHELNQPLTAILFNAQAGKRFLQSGKLDHDQANQIFDNIIDDDKRAGGIISSVRSLMKLEYREKEKIDLNTVIQETVDIIRNDATRHRIKLNVRSSAGPVYVLADKIQIQQVLLNFIRNAEIAMENNDPASKNLELITIVSKDTVTVSVRDSGPGIDSSIREKIFKPFVTTRKGGSGIGLALSRSIIEAHNGSVWAENIPGGGADFSFRLNLLKNE